jgi:hypothetical protein
MTGTRHERATCVHCGSPRIQEACRTADEIIFRCLHCWKTFTLVPVMRLTTPTYRGDDAA